MFYITRVVKTVLLVSNRGELYIFRVSNSPESSKFHKSYRGNGNK